MPGIVLALRNVSKHGESTYHGLNVGMGHGVELLILKLVIGADVDVSAPVFCRVTVSRGRKD